MFEFHLFLVIQGWHGICGQKSTKFKNLKFFKKIWNDDRKILKAAVGLQKFFRIIYIRKGPVLFVLQ